MNKYDYMRAWLDLSNQLNRGEALSDIQRKGLASIFCRIGNGEDANHVLGVSSGRGKKRSDAISRQRISMILHWVACNVQPVPDSSEKVMSIESACAQAVTTIVPVAKRAFPGEDRVNYDEEYIFRCWSEPQYAHMRSVTRGWFDPDFPYYRLPAVKDPK